MIQMPDSKSEMLNTTSGSVWACAVGELRLKLLGLVRFGAASCLFFSPICGYVAGTLAMLHFIPVIAFFRHF